MYGQVAVPDQVLPLPEGLHGLWCPTTWMEQTLVLLTAHPTFDVEMGGVGIINLPPSEKFYV